MLICFIPDKFTPVPFKGTICNVSLNIVLNPNLFYEVLKKNALTSKVNQQVFMKWFTGTRDRGGQRASTMQQIQPEF